MVTMRDISCKETSAPVPRALEQRIRWQVGKHQDIKKKISPRSRCQRGEIEDLYRTTWTPKKMRPLSRFLGVFLALKKKTTTVMKGDAQSAPWLNCSLARKHDKSVQPPSTVTSTERIRTEALLLPHPNIRSLSSTSPNPSRQRQSMTTDQNY